MEVSVIDLRCHRAPLLVEVVLHGPFLLLRVVHVGRDMLESAGEHLVPVSDVEVLIIVFEIVHSLLIQTNQRHRFRLQPELRLSGDHRHQFKLRGQAAIRVEVLGQVRDQILEDRLLRLESRFWLMLGSHHWCIPPDLVMIKMSWM